MYNNVLHVGTIEFRGLIAVENGKFRGDIAVKNAKFRGQKRQISRYLTFENFPINDKFIAKNCYNLNLEENKKIENKNYFRISEFLSNITFLVKQFPKILPFRLEKCQISRLFRGILVFCPISRCLPKKGKFRGFYRGFRGREILWSLIIRTSERIKKDKKDRLIDILEKYFSEILFRTGNEKKAKY